MKNFYQAINALKFIQRKGWLERNLSSDTIASHAFGAMSLGWFIASKEKANKHRVIELLLVHDWVMAVMDDVTPDSGKYETKEALEELAKIKIAKSLEDSLGKEYLNIFDEFQSQITLESHVAKDADKLETLLQGQRYEEETGRKNILDQFLETYKNAFKTKTAKDVFDEIKKNHESLLTSE